MSIGTTMKKCPIRLIWEAVNVDLPALLVIVESELGLGAEPDGPAF
jgi:hypothetical protein